jgi:cold shock protein
MSKGYVRWWAEEKGHGFIRGEDGKDYFVHYSCLNGEGRKNLERDEEVEFEASETPKGPRAVNVWRGVRVAA